MYSTEALDGQKYNRDHPVASSLDDFVSGLRCSFRTAPAKSHLRPASLLSCTSLNARLPLRTVIVPTAASTGRVLNKFQLV